MEKERRTKALLLSTLVVVVATLSIAFAAMSRTLSINGIAKMDTASWSVYFDNLSKANIVRGAQQISAPSISTDKGTVQDINVKLSNPKDEISYTVDIVNDGTIDAEITMIKDIELTDVQKKVFEFKVIYTDTGEVLKDGDILPKDTVKNITINIKFKDDITEFDLPTEAQTINLSYQITYTQYNGNGGEIVGPNGGGISEKAVLSTYFPQSKPVPVRPFFNGTLPRNQVESIDFLNSNIVPSEYETASWDASQNSDGSVMAWYTDVDNNGLYEVYVGGNGGVYAPSDCSSAFLWFSNLVTINFNNNFYTQDITNMFAMFSSCKSLTSLDLSSFNTSNVTDMNGVFFGCEKLTSLDLSSFNTENVTTMYEMFSDCKSLTNIDLSSFNTENVTDMSYMFASCSSLTSLDLTLFNTSNVANMFCMFANCSLLTSLDLSSFNTSKVTNMSWLFNNCSALIDLDFRNADFSNVTSYDKMFANDGSEVNRVIVKDETQRTWVTTRFTNLTNVVLVSEL